VAGADTCQQFAEAAAVAVDHRVIGHDRLRRVEAELEERAEGAFETAEVTLDVFVRVQLEWASRELSSTTQCRTLRKVDEPRQTSDLGHEKHAVGAKVVGAHRPHVRRAATPGAEEGVLHSVLGGGDAGSHGDH
jgi:hypothetical protein